MSANHPFVMELSFVIGRQTYLLIIFKLNLVDVRNGCINTEICFYLPPERLAGSSLIYVFSIRLRTLVLCCVLATCVYLIGRSEVLDTFSCTYLAISHGKMCVMVPPGKKVSDISWSLFFNVLDELGIFTMCVVAYLMSCLVVFGPLWRLP